MHENEHPMCWIMEAAHLLLSTQEMVGIVNACGTVKGPEHVLLSQALLKGAGLLSQALQCKLLWFNSYLKPSEGGRRIWCQVAGVLVYLLLLYIDIF